MGTTKPLFTHPTVLHKKHKKEIVMRPNDCEKNNNNNRKMKATDGKCLFHTLSPGPTP